MATGIDLSNAAPTGAGPAWKPYRLTASQFLTMIDAGIFPPDAHVELLGGMLVERRTKGDPHDFSVGSIAEELRRRTPAGWILREDKSLQLGLRSRLEPDVAIVRGPLNQYSSRTPQASETALVVEVAESSYADDRGKKWRSYAAAGIAEYWIVNLPERRVEVYRDLSGRGKNAFSRISETFGPDDSRPGSDRRPRNRDACRQGVPGLSLSRPGPPDKTPRADRACPRDQPR